MTKPVVYIVEDNLALRESIKAMIESTRQTCEAFENGAHFLDFIHHPSRKTPHPGCVILDVRLPGMNGMDIHTRLRDTHPALPVIFVTGHGDIPMAVQAMEQGAFGFLEKPFREQELLLKVSAALERSTNQLAELKKYTAFEASLASLTSRENMIFELAVNATANKIIADKLGISERTVEVHRSNLLKKFGSKPLAEIIKIYSSYKVIKGNPQ